MKNRLNNFACGSSLITMIIGIVCGLVNLSVKSPVIDIIAVCCLTFWTIPFMIGSVTFTAGIESFIVNSVGFRGWEKAVMYVVVFPFVIMFFVAGIIALFNGYSPHEKINGVLIRQYYRLEASIIILTIHATLITIGLVVRKLRDKKLSIA